MNKAPASIEKDVATDNRDVEQEKEEIVLIERWNDNDAILLNRSADRYELWTVADDGPLILDLPNDGRRYRFVREVTEFELDDDEVSGSGMIQ
jgi:hypothetical protein